MAAAIPARASGPKTRGDALFVDLGGGRNVVALLAVGTAPTELDATNYTAMRSFLAAGRKVQFRDMKKTTAMSPVAVPAENAPRAGQLQGRQRSCEHAAG